MCNSWWSELIAIGIISLGALCVRHAPGQENAVEVKAATPNAAVQPSATPAATAPVAAAKASSGSDAVKSDAQPAKENEGKEKDKEDAPKAPEPVARPKQPPAPADPSELRVRPSQDGIIRFSFRNQPWPAVLQWLADVSQLSLDWQELPGDYLNLTLQRGYTLEEARDVINRHLLARGYTMILEGETLTVVNLAKLNPAIVPRVAPDELPDRQAHEMVKVSFALDWMLAEKAAEELKPMLSPHGKLFPLKESNRLEAIDAVANLREIHRLLSQEQSDGGEERLVREFRLQHTRASDVRILLMELLGMEQKSNGPAAPLSPEQMQMMQQQRQMMQQMAQQQGGAAPAGGSSKKDDVSLVVNPRNNSILATAPPDKMAIVAEAVKMLDVPTGQNDSLLANLTRLQIYRLTGIDPEPLVKTLEELGDLAPQTRLEVDAKNRAIIAYAPLADHVTIRTLVEKLDGSARSLEVIPLRRLSADYVAGTLKFLLSGEEEKPQQRFPYYIYGGRAEEPAKDSFRVDADVENNRLLVWANATELEEVMGLLAKLGEIPERGGDPRRVRTLEVLPSQQSPEFFQRLKKAWESLSPQELRIDPTLEQNAPADAGSGAARESAASQDVGDAASHSSRAADADRQAPFNRSATSLTQLRRTIQDTQREGSLAAPDDAAAGVADRVPDAGLPGKPASRLDEAQPPPVGILRGSDGRLVISSEDAHALDLMEDLVRAIAPQRKDFEVFELKYAPAFWVKLNLEDFFEEKDKKDNRSSAYRWWYYDMPPETETADPRRLSQRRPLKFISDDDTNTIVVQGGDPQQLYTIRELIELYDQPPPEDAQSRRVTQIFTIRYSRAEVVAEAIKDVYRDLLSANDKALSQQQQQQNQRPAGETYITNIGFGDEADQRDRRTQVTFKGKLSIGIDAMTNTLIISTEGEALMRNIQEMILRLDDAAKPRTAVEVLHLGGSGGVSLQQALSEIFREQVQPGHAQPGQLGPSLPAGQTGANSGQNGQTAVPAR